MKKINYKLISIIIIILIIIAGIVYFIFFRNSKEEILTQQLELQPIENIYNINFSKFYQNEEMFYFRKKDPSLDDHDGGYQLYSYNILNGTNELLYDPIIKGIEKAIYSDDQKYVFVKYQWPINSESKNLLIDIQNKQQYQLDKNIQELVILNDRLVYVYQDQDKLNMNISISNINGENYKVLTKIDYIDLGYFLTKFDNENVIYVSKEISPTGNNTNKINIKTSEIEEIYSENSLINPIVSQENKNMISGEFVLSEGTEIPQIGFLDTNTDKEYFLAIEDSISNQLISSTWSGDKLYLSLLNLDNNEKSIYVFNTQEYKIFKYFITTIEDYGAIQNLFIFDKNLYFVCEQSLYSFNLN